MPGGHVPQTGIEDVERARGGQPKAVGNIQELTPSQVQEHKRAKLPLRAGKSRALKNVEITVVEAGR